MKKLFTSFTFQVVALAAVLLSVTTLAITVAVSTQYADTLKRQNQETTLAAFSVASEKIESLLSDARKAGLHAFENDAINRFLAQPPGNMTRYVEYQRDMIMTVRDYLTRHPFLEGLLYISHGNRLFGALQTWSFTDNPNTFTQAVDRQFSDGVTGQIRWIPAARLDSFALTPEASAGQRVRNHRLVFGIELRRLSLSHAQANICMIIVLSPEALISSFSHLYDADSTVALITRDGLPVASAGEPVLDYRSIVAGLEPDSPYGSKEARLNGKAHQIIYYQLPLIDWLLVKAVPMASYTRTIDSLRMAALLTAIVISLLAWLLYGMLSLRFIRPLHQIVAVLRTIGHSGESPRMAVSTGVTEYALISTQFNHMLDRLEESHIREIAAQRVSTIQEIRRLQAQIRPHFIYNSIAAIRWLATILGAHKVSEMLIELAEILKPLFSEWRLVWPLGEELNYLQHYIKLLQLRFGNDFSLSLDCPEDMMDICIPRFILQPIIENACEHGKGDNGKIGVGVSVMRDGGTAIIRIWDHGRGIKPQRLEELRDMLAHSDLHQEKGSSVGLLNVHRRLQLHCGSACGVTIDSRPGEGAQFTLHISLESCQPSAGDAVSGPLPQG